MNYRSPKKPWRSVYREKGSKFIACLHPAENEADITGVLGNLRSEFQDASHHCYAWRIDPGDIREFSQDDGEPSGTAGLPILNAMRSARIINGILVVIRYFGGTKLGKGGLIQSYGGSASEVLNMAELNTLKPYESLILQYPYSCSKHIEILLNRIDFIVSHSNYGQAVELHIGVQPDQYPVVKNGLEELMHLGIRFEHTGKNYLILQTGIHG